tara:strand:- start:312 stop:440 length:129 start_codon:yes stop_codon:yes gene_type:complete
MGVDSLVTEFSNIGLTILCVVVGVIIVNWLDRNVFNKNRWRD